MALVDDDVGEVVLGVVGGQEVGVAVLVFHAKGLVGGDVDAGVLGVVRAVRLAVHLGGVGAEDVLKGLERLGAEFVAVTDEQGAGELPGVGDALEQVDGDEGLARAGGQGQQRALGLLGDLALGDLLHDGADGGVLVVAPGALAAGVWLQERPGGRRFEREAHALLIAGAKLGRGWGTRVMGLGAEVSPVKQSNSTNWWPLEEKTKWTL